MGYKYGSYAEYRIANNQQKREKYWSDEVYRESQKTKARNRSKPHTPLKTDIRRSRSFGLSIIDLQKLLESQDFRCAICGDLESEVLLKTKKRLALDHEHGTQKIRGLLCGPCNRALGLFKDSIKILQNAENYLGNGKG